MTNESTTIASVNSNNLSLKDEYVCWIDIMGTKNIMSESIQKATNFIFRFHSCVVDVIDNNTERIKAYPLMDGVFITTPNAETMKKIINEIFSKAARMFLEADKHGHRFVIKGSLAYGLIAHGESIDELICPTVAQNNSYKSTLMLGMPMIQAVNSEKTAPPFGIYIHESARKYKVLQGKHYAWKPINVDKNELRKRIQSYFDWCNDYSEYLEMDATKIKLYKKLVDEYFNDRMKKDHETETE